MRHLRNDAPCSGCGKTIPAGEKCTWTRTTPPEYYCEVCADYVTKPADRTHAVLVEIRDLLRESLS